MNIWRDERGRIRPGSPSLNPGGRQRAISKLLEAARESVPNAFKFAVLLMNDKTVDPRVRLDAAKMIISYGVGSPPRMEMTDQWPNNPCAHMSDDELFRVARKAIKEHEATLTKAELNRIEEG